MTSYDATKHCKISLSGIFFFNRGNLKNNIVLFFLSLSVRKHALRCDVSFSCRAYEIKNVIVKSCSYLQWRVLIFNMIKENVKSEIRVGTGTENHKGSLFATVLFYFGFTGLNAST